MNARLVKILDWCRFNKMSQNLIKSEFMLITTKLVATKPLLFHGSDEIICRNSEKFLGTNIDKNLKFASHIENMSSKLA